MTRNAPGPVCARNQRVHLDGGEQLAALATQSASGPHLQWRPARFYPSFAIFPLRVASSPGVMPVGCRTAFHPSTNSAVYTWPWPGGTLAANGRSALTSQKVTRGTQNIALSTSLPGGWLIQSGSLKIRSGLHHTTGSDGCIRYRTRGPLQGWPFGGMPVVGSLANRTIRPSW